MPETIRPSLYPGACLPLRPAEREDPTRFPPDAITGSAGYLARVLTAGTEVPVEFAFCSALTVMGALVEDQLTLDIGTDVDPRLYTVLLGESADAKKSSSVRKVLDFFGRLRTPPHVVTGAGSAEGIARQLSNNTILTYDELRAFVDKSKVKGSVLLPMVTSLFEGRDWDNPVKSEAASVSVHGARLSLIGCCTTQTYASMWTPEAISIGFPNRLFVVTAGGQPPVAWPTPPDPEALRAAKERIEHQLARLPLRLPATTAAKEEWRHWYERLPRSEHAKRLDTIGFRLMALLGLTTDGSVVDPPLVRLVTSILDYELNVRTLHDPVDADNVVARLEEKVRRVLRAKGPCTKRDLRRATNADRDGVYWFDKALANLVHAGDIQAAGQRYQLAEAA